MSFKQKETAVFLVFLVLFASACGFRRKAYDNPITKDTQQPDKVLFDRAINDIEHGRYEVARLTLNTLINTYDTSEYLAKAKLAIADSWYREGGPHGMAQAEAEYKDFILFYPAMEESAESQEKICMIHYKQMDKPDRDPNNALRAEQECRTLLTQFPNSKFAPLAEQRLREIQEVLAEAEFRVGYSQYKKGTNAAATARFEGLVQQYPLYSGADQALWYEADSYSRMGPRWRQKQGDALAKLVHDYPLSPLAEQAKKKLQSLEMPIPEADPAAVARMKYEQENHSKSGMVSRTTEFLHHGPDLSKAAKSGSPTMDNPKPQIPVSVPAVASASPGFSGDVTVAPVTDPTALDTKPDARLNPPASASGAPSGTKTDAPKASATPDSTSSTSTSTPAANSTDQNGQQQQPLDTKSKNKKDDKKKKKSDKTDDKSKPSTSGTTSSTNQPDK
jgi:outer membrane protein assembly factor BamD